MIDDQKMTATGSVRTFKTPALPAGGHYVYTLKATAGDKMVTRKVHLRQGGTRSFDLREGFRPDRPSPQDRREPR